MPHAHFPQTPHWSTDVPDEFEPDSALVEPDQGPAPTFIPDDPEHDRMIDPGENGAWQTRRSLNKDGSAKWL